MKKFLLLPLLLGLPSPLFAGSSTSGYKEMDKCTTNGTKDYKATLWKKENSNSKKWGSYLCTNTSAIEKCEWRIKDVSYDQAHSQFEDDCLNE